jgi:uncharacterized protein YehS (DUF1456 family)
MNDNDIIRAAKTILMDEDSTMLEGIIKRADVSIEDSEMSFTIKYDKINGDLIGQLMQKMLRVKVVVDV